MFRSPKLLRSAKDQPCVICGDTGTTVSCHSNFIEHGKGTGIKASDVFTARLCGYHHDLLDGRAGKLTKQEKWELFARAHQRTVEAWFKEGLVVVK